MAVMVINNNYNYNYNYYNYNYSLKIIELNIARIFTKQDSGELIILPQVPKVEESNTNFYFFQ